MVDLGLSLLLWFIGAGVFTFVLFLGFVLNLGFYCAVLIVALVYWFCDCGFGFSWEFRLFSGF